MTLPQKDMVDLYKTLTSNLSITSSSLFTAKAKPRSADIEKVLRTHGPIELKEIKYFKGVIRSRILKDETAWRTELLEAAVRL